MQDASDSSDTRVGMRSYTDICSYDSRGPRTLARRTESGVLSHNGANTCDDAVRPAQVVDAATQQTELFTRYADGTLAADPGPGHNRLLDSDEEGASSGYGATMAAATCRTPWNVSMGTTASAAGARTTSRMRERALLAG